MRDVDLKISLTVNIGTGYKATEMDSVSPETADQLRVSLVLPFLDFDPAVNLNIPPRGVLVSGVGQPDNIVLKG